MRVSIGLVWALMLCGCATFGSVSGLSLFGGYRMLDMPAAAVPIGAAWRDGQPVRGGGTRDIVIERSFNALQLSRETQRDLQLGFIRFLDLHPRFESMISISVADITIHSVTEPDRLGLQRGEQFILSAMKAGKITIAVESGYSIGLVSGLKARGLTPSVEGSQAGRSRISVEGADLFFAYKLDRFEK